MVDLQEAVLAAWITNQEGFDLAKAAVESLKKAGLKLIIVDNASLLGGGYLRAAADIYVRNWQNLGYAPAMNQGLKLTKGEFVALAATDIIVSPNSFSEGVRILRGAPKVGMAHFRMVGFNEPLELGNSTWIGGKEPWCTISFMLWRKQALPKGFFDENFKLANYEDYDILYRARKNGWLSAYTNRAGFKHHDSYFQKLLNQEERQTLAKENREYFKKKHGEYPDVLFDKLYPLTQPYRPFP